MVNPFKDTNWNPDIGQRRRFARSLIIGFPCLAVFLALSARLTSGTWNLAPSYYLGGIGAGVGLVLFVLPAIARPVYVVWYAVACSIGLVVGNLLLGSIYFLVVSVLGLLRRATRHRPIQRRPNREASSYWHEAEKHDDDASYFSQY